MAFLLSQRQVCPVLPDFKVCIYTQQGSVTGKGQEEGEGGSLEPKHDRFQPSQLTLWLWTSI